VSPGEEWLTLGQAARQLGVAQSTVRKWSDRGLLPAFYTPGGHRRFRRRELDSFLRSSGSAAAARRAGPLVLVVGAEAQIRAALREPLERAGYTVGEAESGLQALAVLEERNPELVLLDLVVGGGESWPLLRQLHERHPTIPVLTFAVPVEQSAAADQELEESVALPSRFDAAVLVGRARLLVPV
jgi:excisionase family DNA binding protein